MLEGELIFYIGEEIYEAGIIAPGGLEGHFRILGLASQPRA